MKNFMKVSIGVFFPFAVPIITRKKQMKEKELYYDGICLGLGIWITILIVGFQLFLTTV